MEQQAHPEEQLIALDIIKACKLVKMAMEISSI